MPPHNLLWVCDRSIRQWLPNLWRTGVRFWFCLAPTPSLLVFFLHYSCPCCSYSHSCRCPCCRPCCCHTHPEYGAWFPCSACSVICGAYTVAVGLSLLFDDNPWLSHKGCGKIWLGVRESCCHPDLDAYPVTAVSYLPDVAWLCAPLSSRIWCVVSDTGKAPYSTAVPRPAAYHGKCHDSSAVARVPNSAPREFPSPD